MKLNYDQEADALSIRLSDDAVSRTEQIDSGTLVDLDRFGAVVAIEVLNPARRWPLDEIIESFDLGLEDAQMLASLWESPQAYPFAPRPAPVAG